MRASFTPRSLYAQGKSHQYPLDEKLSGPQSQYERNIILVRGILYLKDREGSGKVT
jgi:hypothetical protein